jgi:uncharacterized protein
VKIRLRLLPDRYAICRLEPRAEIPPWARGELVSVTRTVEELSIVCPEEGVPATARSESGWRCLMVEGPIPFETTGVAAAITSPLAAAGISVFFLSTFDTDYVLVKETVLQQAMDALRKSGCSVLGAET